MAWASVGRWGCLFWGRGGRGEGGRSSKEKNIYIIVSSTFLLGVCVCVCVFCGHMQDE